MSSLLLITLAAVVWISGAALVVAMCVMAARGDGRPAEPRAPRSRRARPKRTAQPHRLA